jgi:hypothetical protein
MQIPRAPCKSHHLPLALPRRHRGSELRRHRPAPLSAGTGRVDLRLHLHDWTRRRPPPPWLHASPAPTSAAPPPHVAGSDLSRCAARAGVPAAPACRGRPELRPPQPTRLRLHTAANSAGSGRDPSGRPRRRAGPARKIGHRAVPGSPVRHDARHGPAQKIHQAA